MYDLMEQTDKFMRILLGMSPRLRFLLWLYETYVPTRIWIMTELCAVARISSHLWKNAIRVETQQLASLRRLQKSFRTRIIFSYITNILKTTIGASSNYFKAVLQSSMLQYEISL